MLCGLIHVDACMCIWFPLSFCAFDSQVRYGSVCCVYFMQRRRTFKNASDVAAAAVVHLIHSHTHTQTKLTTKIRDSHATKNDGRMWWIRCTHKFGINIFTRLNVCVCVCCDELDFHIPNIIILFIFYVLQKIQRENVCTYFASQFCIFRLYK